MALPPPMRGATFFCRKRMNRRPGRLRGSLAGFSARLRVPLPEIVSFSDEDNWEKQTDGFARENKTESKRFPVFNSLFRKDGLHLDRFSRIITMCHVG